MSKFTPASFRNAVNRQIGKMETYHAEIPLDAMFQMVADAGGRAVQEDGTDWSGILCGEEGHTVIEVKHPETSVKFGLYIGWYKMASGRYEVTAYIS